MNGDKYPGKVNNSVKDEVLLNNWTIWFSIYLRHEFLKTVIAVINASISAGTAD